jgi:hypothetical protein
MIPKPRNTTRKPRTVGGVIVSPRKTQPPTVLGFLVVFLGFGIIGHEQLTDALLEFSDRHAVPERITDRAIARSERAYRNEGD